jgi:autophagy-related protein 18
MRDPIAPCHVLFPGQEVIGYKTDHRVMLFSPTQVCPTIFTFASPLLFFSLPFDDHYILAVFSNSPSSLLLWNTVSQTVETSLKFGSPIASLVFSETFSCVVTSIGLTVVRNRPLVIHYALECEQPLAGAAVAGIPSDPHHCTLAHPDDADPSMVIVRRIPSSLPAVTFRAHKRDIAMLCLSRDSRFLATASAKGTVVRLWSNTGALVRESRRGFFNARIVDLSFSMCGGFLCATSDHMTAHVFTVEEDVGAEQRWFLARAALTVALPQGSPITAFVLSAGKVLCAVSDCGECSLYDIDIGNATSVLRSKLQIPALARLAL